MAPLTRFRAFRNGDPPALADLWNRGLPDRGAVRPLDPHEFDALVTGRLTFDRAGLIVAERAGRIVAFAHAGFGPEEPEGPSHRFDTALGTVAMVVVEPGLDDPELDVHLMAEAIAYLRSRGASVFYAGGRHPLDPFYWGLYGGSEFSGVLSAHVAFHRAAMRAGFEPVAETALLEVDLTDTEPRDPRAALVRRQVRLEIVEDAVPSGWWESQAIGLFRPCRYLLIDRQDEAPVARASTWDIAGGIPLEDGRNRVGLIGLEVDPAHRRKGFGRHLVAEVLRHARSQSFDLVAAQTDTTNAPALELYLSLGFEQVESATLYRLPAAPPS